MLDGTTCYATDEDIAVRVSADYTVLVPKDQKLAWGDDGAFVDGARWVLSSRSVDFQAAGLVPGHVVLLTHPASAFRGPAETFVVSRAAGNLLTLRRKGQKDGEGQPPASTGPGGLVEFCSWTFGPQLARASYDLDRRFGIDESVPGRRPSDLFDLRELREAAVLTVLYRQYMDLCRGSEALNDSFAMKTQLFRTELEGLLARLVLHWSSPVGPSSADGPASRFCTRIGR